MEDAVSHEPAPRRGQRLLAVMQPIARQAALLVGRVRTLSLVVGGAGVWLWALLFWPFDFAAGWTLALAVLLLLALLLPAAVLGLFTLGLHELITLPERVVASVRSGQDEAVAVYADVTDAPVEPAGRGRQFWRVVRGLWTLRAVVLESRDLLIGSAALIRLANPFVLVLVLAAAGLGLLLIAGAVVGTLIALVV